MQKYLNYLLQDIANAARDAYPALETDEDDLDEYFEEVERFVHDMNVTHIEFCSYDPDDHCPFAVDNCPCVNKCKKESIYAHLTLANPPKKTDIRD